MPRPRKPTAALELSGAFDKHPDRRRSRAMEPRPHPDIGKPPAYFDAELREVWKEYVREAAVGVLTSSDRKVLELTCRLTVKLRLAPGKMRPWLNALGDLMLATGSPQCVVDDMKNQVKAGLGMSTQESALLQNCLKSMGFTPADRSRVHVRDSREPEVDDALEEFASAVN